MKKVLFLSLALILLLGITGHGTSSYFSDTETSTGNTFTAWVEECVCSIFNVSDDGDDKIYKYNDLGNFVGSFGLSGDNGRPTGVATVGGYVYVIDHAKKQVYKYDCCGTLEDVSKELLTAVGPSSIGNIDGLAIDSGADEMWVLSGNDKNIYRYPLGAAFSGSGDINAAQEITLDTANKGAVGLAIDSTYLYVLDSADKRFYRYDRSTGVCGVGDVSKVLKESLVSGGGDLYSPAGAMFDGTYLWVVDDRQAQQKDKVYKYDVDSLFDGSGTTEDALWEFDLDADNIGSTGL